MGNIKAAITFMILLGGAQQALAQEPHGDGPQPFDQQGMRPWQQRMRGFGNEGTQYGGPRGQLREIIEKLGLSDEQREKLRALRQNSDMRELREKLFKDKEELKGLFKVKDSDERKIREKLDVVLSTINELGHKRVENLLEMRKILNAEQYQTLFNELEQRRPMGPGGFRPPPQGGMHQGGPGGMRPEGMPPHGMRPDVMGQHGPQGGPPPGSDSEGELELPF